MPTFTAVALERLLEPGASQSVDKSVHTEKILPYPKPEGRNTEPIQERMHSLPQKSPALYATPEAIPLPDSPSLFSPSPYIINYKGRWPHLSKSFSENDMPSCQKARDEETAKVNAENSNDMVAKLKKSASVMICTPELIEKDHLSGGSDAAFSARHLYCAHGGEVGTKSVELDGSTRGLVTNNVSDKLEKENNLPKSVAVKSERESQSEKFYDPRESMSFASNSEGEDNAGAENPYAFSTPMADFYDACEELSSDSGRQASVHNMESELREIRLSLLMEIEKRKQAEEALNRLRACSLKIVEQLGQVGLMLPVDPIAEADGQQPEMDISEELSHQFHIARFVSGSLGRGMAKAEAETEMEAQIESKNFEIARLSDRLHYYEAVHHEISQRNQEAVETARRDGQRRERRQRWVWGSITAAIALGAAALAWSYFPSGKTSSSATKAPVEEDA